MKTEAGMPGTQTQDPEPGAYITVRAPRTPLETGLLRVIAADSQMGVCPAVGADELRTRAAAAGIPPHEVTTGFAQLIDHEHLIGLPRFPGGSRFWAIPTLDEDEILPDTAVLALPCLPVPPAPTAKRCGIRPVPAGTPAASGPCQTDMKAELKENENR